MHALRRFNCSAPTAAFFRENRTRAIQRLLSAGALPAESFILLAGPVEQEIYDDDMEFQVAPENCFYHLMGIADKDTYGLIDVQNNFATLFVAFADPQISFWTDQRSKEYYLTTGRFDEVLGLDALKSTLQNRVGAKRLFLYAGTNPLSGLPVAAGNAKLRPQLEGCDVDETTIFEHFCEERVRKTADELRLMRQSVDLAVLGHTEAMKEVSPGATELEVANKFEFVLRYTANADTAFETVVACGRNGQFSEHTPSGLSVLEKGQLVVIEAGVRLFGYSSDVARTLPVDRAFNPKQRQIYDAVANTHEDLLDIVKPGISWKEVNRQAELHVLRALRSLGVLRGDVKAMEAKRVAYFFFPQSIGGYIGLYRHDLPGLAELEKDPQPLPLCELKVTRVLEKDMTLTLGAGIYFSDELLSKALEDPGVSEHINAETLREFAEEVGGVLIRDQILVTKDGCEVLSKALPTKAEDVELFRKELESSRPENI